ncbi:c-type cytochrome [Rhodopila globiformis]|nr:transporter substrate-binding domain-containing protein [Rhodopila globiformis]
MRRTFLTTLMAGTALFSAVSTSQAAAPLRLCADPANLPFSTSSPAAAKAGTPGLYVEIGQAVADALGRPMETIWSLSYFGKRNLRTTLLAGQCDFAVGLPAVEDFMGPRVVFSRPIMSVGYALAVPKDAGTNLNGKRVAVQFASPPQSFVATRETITPATVMDPDAGMRLLADGKVDAAFVWGPSAGYVNHAVLHDAFRVVPADGPQMRYEAAIGFSRKNKELRDQVNAVLPGLSAKIAALVVKYAVPEGPPVKLAAMDTVQSVIAEAQAPAETPKPEAKPAEQPAVASVNPTAEAPKAAPKPSAAEVAEGREIFNGTCAHCHGPDAVQSERRINLRLLRHRYGDDMYAVFHKTVTKGRPSKGMPTWGNVFTEDDFSKIYAFLSTIQAP